MRLLLLAKLLSAVETAESAPRNVSPSLRALFGKDTHPDNKAALMHTVKLLESLVILLKSCPEYDQERLTYAYYIVVSTGLDLVYQMESKRTETQLDELEMSTGL